LWSKSLIGGPSIVFFTGRIYFCFIRVIYPLYPQGVAAIPSSSTHFKIEIMSNTDELYIGCPVQHARQFIAGKWQMGILWNLRDQSMGFSEIKSKLPGLSDKILMQELDFFVQNKIIDRNSFELPTVKIEYALSSIGRTLIPVINSIVEWGYLNLQDEQVSKEMSMTPLPAIDAIEAGVTARQNSFTIYNLGN